MKTKVLSLLLAGVMLTVTGCHAEEQEPQEPQTPPTETPENPDTPEEPSEPTGDGKALVVYFSHTGNTRTIAGYVHEMVEGSDMVELETVDAYTDDYDTLLAQVREEVANGYCPPLATQIADLPSYDVIFVGYPIWVETAAPPIRTFLTTHDLSGKTVIPFCTSGTSSAEASFRLVRSLCPNSTVLDGIQIRRGTYDTARERVAEWLQQIGIVKTE